MTLDWIKIVLALLLFWPRGYVLIYLIDRSKSMSFGFKFFAGWLLGLAGFTLDIFAAVAVGGLELSWLIFLNSSVSQIFGFSLMIYLVERKLPYPKLKNFWPWVSRQVGNLRSWTIQEKTGLLLLTAIIIFVSAVHFSVGVSWHNPATAVYPGLAAQLDNLSQTAVANPLNDALLKLWLLEVGGSLTSQGLGLAWIFYYLLLLGFFYHLLPLTLKRSYRLGAVCLLALFSSVYFNANISDVNLYFSIFVLMAVGCLYYFIAGRGLSWYYLAGMGLALAVWTANVSLVLLLPAMAAVTLILLLAGRVSAQDFFLQWFFTILTVVPWLFFVILHSLNIFPPTVDLHLSTLAAQLLPSVLLFLTLFFAKVKLYDHQAT